MTGTCEIFRYVDVVIRNKMDFQSAMETFAEAWAAANTVKSEAPSDLSQVIFDIYPLLFIFSYIFCFFFFHSVQG